MSTMLVTGGAGFIGANFVRLALQRGGARVVVFDKLTYAGSLENLREVEAHPGLVFIRGDIADRAQVEAAYREHKPETVVNFAAESHVDRSIDGPAEFVRTNINGTFELLDAARAYLGEDEKRRSSFRLLHVSTDEVYGSLGAEGRFSEETAYAPNSPYAASKAAADHLVRAYHQTYGLPTLLTNCSNNYGPLQFPEKLIPLMILNALEGKALPIYGDGGNVRDWLYVEDHCHALLQVLRQGRVGESYNVGGDAEHTNLEVVDRICDCLEEARPAKANEALSRRGLSSYRDLRQFVQDRPGHDWRYAIDASRIQRDLGWQPQHDFGAGLRNTVRWYLENRDWCEAVERGQERRRLGIGLGAGA